MLLHHICIAYGPVAGGLSTAGTGSQSVWSSPAVVAAVTCCYGRRGQCCLSHQDHDWHTDMHGRAIAGVVVSSQNSSKPQSDANPRCQGIVVMVVQRLSVMFGSGWFQAVLVLMPAKSLE